jgi:diacylglycerol kinase
MFMMQPPASSRTLPARSAWAAFIAGFGYAFSGLWYVLRTRRNTRIHVMVALLAITAGIFPRTSAIEFAIMFVATSNVFIAELFNTRLEACVDLASPQQCRGHCFV